MTAKSEQGPSQAREGHVSIITVIWSLNGLFVAY